MNHECECDKRDEHINDFRFFLLFFLRHYTKFTPKYILHKKPLNLHAHNARVCSKWDRERERWEVDDMQEKTQLIIIIITSLLLLLVEERKWHINKTSTWSVSGCVCIASLMLSSKTLNFSFSQLLFLINNCVCVCLCNRHTHIQSGKTVVF